MKTIRSGLNSSHDNSPLSMSGRRVCEDRLTEPPLRGAAGLSTERAQPQRDLKREGLHRVCSIRAQSDRRVSSEASTASKIGTTSGQVFWLPDHSTNRAFPRIQSQWRLRRSSPDTAAGPRRIQTVFPILSKQHASSTQVGGHGIARAGDCNRRRSSC